MSEEEVAHILARHRRRPSDSGEYVCECGWVPDWHGLPLADQIKAHREDVLRSAGVGE